MTLIGNIADINDAVLTGHIVGIKGDTGTGIASIVENADYTLTINLTNGSSYTTDPIAGFTSVDFDEDYNLVVTKTDGTTETVPTDIDDFRTVLYGYKQDAETAESNASGYASNASGSASSAQTYSYDSEAWAKGTRNGTAVTSGTDGYQDNSKYYKEQASSSASSAGTSATNASNSALKSEGYAIGKQNGTDVTNDSVYYHNNAKYYAEEASTSATNASASESTATAAAGLLTNCSATATTLAAGSNATASYASGVFSFGIPKGVDGSLASGVLAATYSSSSTYTVGDYAYYSGDLYRCVAEIETAEAWTAGHWVQVALTDDVSNLKDDLNTQVIDIKSTNFAKRVGSIKNDTTLAEIDSHYKTYSGRVFTKAGVWTTSSALSCYAFRSPQDNFAISANVRDMAIVSDYPDNNNNTIDIVSLLIDGQTSGYTDVVIPHRGDIVIFNILDSLKAWLLTDIKSNYETDGLVLNESEERFLRYADIGTSLNSLGNERLNITKKSGRLVNATYGSLTSNASYDTYYFKVPVQSLTVKCTNGFRAAIVRTEPKDDGDTAFLGGYALKQLLYQYSSGRVDTFTATYNDYVVISISASDSLNLITNYMPTFSLAGFTVDGIIAGQYYRYNESGGAKYLNVYFASGNHVVAYELHNAPAPLINSNTWQLGAIYSYDFDGKSVSNGVELVAGGEFELAWKEYGAADYCGGNNHGDENTIDFTLLIDGKKIDLSSMDTKFHAFNRIDAIEHAYINRCDTPGDNILKHQKIWVFENGTVKVRQTLEFLEALNCDFLCCMLAANRSCFTSGVRQGRTEVEDMSTSTYTPISTEGNEMMYLMYGDNVSAKITARTCDHTPKAKLWINPASAVNKLYYNFFGQIPNTAVANGTILTWESEYDVAYNN